MPKKVGITIEEGLLAKDLSIQWHLLKENYSAIYATANLFTPYLSWKQFLLDLAWLFLQPLQAVITFCISLIQLLIRSLTLLKNILCFFIFRSSSNEGLSFIELVSYMSWATVEFLTTPITWIFIPFRILIGAPITYMIRLFTPKAADPNFLDIRIKDDKNELLTKPEEKEQIEDEKTPFLKENNLQNNKTFSIPKEIVAQIFSYSSVTDLIESSFTSKTFYHFCQKELSLRLKSMPTYIVYGPFVPDRRYYFSRLSWRWIPQTYNFAPEETKLFWDKVSFAKEIEKTEEIQETVTQNILLFPNLKETKVETPGSIFSANHKESWSISPNSGELINALYGFSKNSKYFYSGDPSINYFSPCPPYYSSNICVDVSNLDIYKIEEYSPILFKCIVIDRQTVSDNKSENIEQGSSTVPEESSKISKEIIERISVTPSEKSEESIKIECTLQIPEVTYKGPSNHITTPPLKGKLENKQWVKPIAYSKLFFFKEKQTAVEWVPIPHLPKILYPNNKSFL